jgi:hypothetical protein
MQNILKIILFKGEERLACILTATYEISLEEEMIFKAIEYRHIHWLMYVWAFQKNYIGLRNT